MTNKKYFKYSVIALTAAMSAMTSCTDTWDDHYAEVTNPGATKSLWEVICENPKLTYFKEIAEKAKYYRDEKHPNAYTYADMFKSDRTMTVWAPENGYLDEATYKDLLSQCETNGYYVHRFFMQSHIALFRYPLTGDSTILIKTIGGKNADFNKKERTFHGFNIGDANQSAFNGTLHTIQGVAPMSYNFYELIKMKDYCPEVRDFMVARDTIYFDKDRSIEGYTNADGNPEYVDSVYATLNRMMGSSYYWPSQEKQDTWYTPEKGFGGDGHLDREDSTLIAVLVSSKAMQAAKDKLRPYYKYNKYYADQANYNTSTDSYNKELAYNIPTDKIDSISDLNMTMDIITPLIFNLHKQRKENGKSMTLDEFIAGEKTNYYLNTFGDTIRSTETWNHAELFQNCREEQTSNGYAYITDNWNLPIEFYKPDVVVEVNSGTMFNASKTINKDATTAQISIDSKIFTDKYGKVGKNNFFYVEASSVTANPVMQIELKPNTDDAYMPNADVMSGKYDIQAVFVPMWYYDVVEKGADEYLKIDGDTIVIDEEKIDSAKNKNILKLACKIYYNSEKCSNTKPVDNYTVKQADTEGINLNEYYVTKVDTVTLIKDFEFPCTYKNIRSRGSNQKKSYPILEIKPNANKSYTSKGYSNSFCIDRIILRSKETGQTTTIIP